MQSAALLPLKWRIHPGYETQRRRHQKSKTGVSEAPQKGLISSILLKKEWHVELKILKRKQKTSLHHLFIIPGPALPGPLWIQLYIPLTLCLASNRSLIVRESSTLSLHWMTFIFRRSCELHTLLSNGPMWFNTARQWSCGKVMFSVVSVCLSPYRALVLSPYYTSSSCSSWASLFRDLPLPWTSNLFTMYHCFVVSMDYKLWNWFIKGCFTISLNLLSLFAACYMSSLSLYHP